MDNFHPQSGDLHVAVGHEEGDFSLRGIILFIVVLVVSAAFTFLAAAGLLRLFEWVEVKYFDTPATPVQQQLSEQRGQMAKKEEVRPQPFWYNREIDAKALSKTFPTPRLQDDDAADMNFFQNNETQWLNSTGKNEDGSIRIPIDQAIERVSEEGLPTHLNGTFTSEPPKGGLMAVAEAAQNRVKAAGEQVQPAPQNKKK
jgi:hypothetical protein